MRKEERICRQNNNSGFSLVELLIAVTILAIIVIPLMHLFVTSTKINVKSRETLRSTTIAQDIMEGCKAYDVPELQEQFNHPEEGFYVIDRQLIKGKLEELSEKEGGQEGLYYFTMRDVTMQGSHYDVQIKVDGRGYMEKIADDSITEYPELTGDPMDPAVYVVHNNEHNNTKMAKIGSVVKGQDGMFVEKDNLKDKALDKIWKAFETEFEADGYTRDDLKFTTKGLEVAGNTNVLMISRIIQVDLKDSGVKDEEGNVKIDAMVSVNYECSYLSWGRVEMVSVVNQPADSNDFAGENFYLFYYPQYGAGEDMITFHNENKLPLQLIIVKQIADDENMTDTQLYLAEEAYSAEVDLKGFEKEQLTIRTNLGTSLVNHSYLEKEDSVKEDEKRVTLYLDGNRKAFRDLKVYTLAGERLGENPIEADEDMSQVIYDVDVAIYKQGAADKDFPTEERVMLLSGSKID